MEFSILWSPSVADSAPHCSALRMIAWDPIRRFWPFPPPVPSSPACCCSPSAVIHALPRHWRPAVAARSLAMKKTKRKSAPRRDLVDLGWLQGSVTFHLRYAQDKSFRTMTRRARAKHWRPGVFSILVVVQQNPGINQTQLSRAIGRDKSSLTDTLLTLDEEGLVTRARTHPARARR